MNRNSSIFRYSAGILPAFQRTCVSHGMSGAQQYEVVVEVYVRIISWLNFLLFSDIVVPAEVL